MGAENVVVRGFKCHLIEVLGQVRITGPNEVGLCALDSIQLEGQVHYQGVVHLIKKSYQNCFALIKFNMVEIGLECLIKFAIVVLID